MDDKFRNFLIQQVPQPKIKGTGVVVKSSDKKKEKISEEKVEKK